MHSSLYNQIKKERYIICGIFGYVKSKPEPFDFMEFCTLGVHNDTRGKDSVGIYIDGESEYYCKGANKSLFSDFIPESRLLQSVTTAQVAYGHDRAASVGDVSVKTAQPVILRDDDGKIEYVLMHNGTIHNYKELARKYIPDVNISGLTDSQVMARIFFNSGYGALGEYNGGAVFAIIDYREETPKYLFWRGYSKKSQYSVQNTQEERPLFFLKSDGELMFSSLNTYLKAFRRKANSLVPTPNVLISYNPATQEFKSIEEYDRSSCFQDKPYCSSCTTTATVSHTYAPSYHTGAYSNDYVYADTASGLCYANGALMHGKYRLSDYGYVNPTGSMSANDMWFWQGVLLKNQEAFMYLEKFCDETNISKEEMGKWYAELVRYLSPYPYMLMIKNGISTMYKVNDPAGSVEYTGDVCYPFMSYMKTYFNGIYQKTKTDTIAHSLEEWRLHKDDALDIDTLIKF